MISYDHDTGVWRLQPRVGLFDDSGLPNGLNGAETRSRDGDGLSEALLLLIGFGQLIRCYVRRLLQIHQVIHVAGRCYA